VADLFEAWVLFQFGKLILEEVGESIAKHAHRCLEVANDEESIEHQALSNLEQDLVDSHRAVQALTWVGTMLFVGLCLVQTACSIWPYLVGQTYDQDTVMFTLQVAGFVASCAAIYNLVVVEQAFHRHLDPISPLLKFFTVKMLVSLSFLQSGALSILQAGEKLLPETTQTFLHWVPFLGDILTFSDVQFKLFYSALTMFECFLLAVLHLLVWKANEAWYKDANTGLETEPLVRKD